MYDRMKLDYQTDFQAETQVNFVSYWIVPLQKRKMNEDEPFVVVEEEPEIDEGALCLDWYNNSRN